MVVSEIFAGLQGEGPSIGIPSVFLRLSGCNLECKWCDTLSIWKKGKTMTPMQVADAILSFKPISKEMLQDKAAHLVITGGEPLMEHNHAELIEMLDILARKLDAKYPYVEVETNGTQRLLKFTTFAGYASQINCSPKLSNSDEPFDKRYKRDVIIEIAKQQNSFFKFVISSVEDWKEIERDFLPLIVDKKKIYLMPSGIDRDELIKNSQLVWELAMDYGVRSTTRLQTVTWNNLHGY